MSLLIVGSSSAFAQGPTDGAPDPSRVRVKIGPLWLNPSIALTNLGIDTNVFNDPDDALPKRDFTFTLSPQTDVWMRIGRTWLTGAIKDDIVWYQKYSSERSGNTSYSLGWKVPLNYVAFSVKAGWLSTRERPGFEIDARAPRHETTYGGTAEIRALSKTFFGVTGNWLKADFDETAVFLNANLHDELNHTSTTVGVMARHQPTPLTTITFAATRIQDRFGFSSLRDSNSTAFTGTLHFDPAALLSGSVALGYRDFQPLSAGVSSYQGSTVAVDLSYSVFGTTKFGGSMLRDVAYSYDVNQPYYLFTGISGSLAQQIFGPLDVVGRIGRQHLDYRDRAGAAVAVSNRSDYVKSYGGGIGYHFGKDTRFGINIDHQTRTSGVANRRYSGLKYGTSVTYGS